MRHTISLRFGLSLVRWPTFSHRKTTKGIIYSVSLL